MVHPRPETLPILIPVTISSSEDLANIEAAAVADPGYLISVYTYRRYIVWGNSYLINVQSVFLQIF